MDIEYLREYLTVADELSFTEAAKVLNTTQSTLSKHVAALERDMGADLLQRTRRGIELTQAGTVLYRRARMIVDLYAGAREEVGRIAKRDPVRVGGMIQNGEVMSLLTHAWPIAQERLATGMPYSPVEVVSFMASLQRGNVDVLLCHEAPDADPELVGKRLLLTSPFLLIVEESNPLASRPSVTMDDLRDMPFVQLLGEYATCGWHAIEKACRAHGYEPARYPIVTNTMFDCLTEPFGGAGMIIQRSVLPNGTLPRSDLRAIPVTGPEAMFSLYAYYRLADEKRLAVLLDTFEEAANNVQKVLEAAQRSASGKPFQTRCRRLAAQFGLNETELAATVAFAKGRSVERIGTEMGLGRMAVGDLLAGVYQKVGVHDKQELLDAIEAMPLV